MAGPTPHEGAQADYRFLLANERTFLAWLRTALSLQVAGLGVLQFLTHSHDSVRFVLGLGLVITGSYVGVVSFQRYYSNEKAIRAGEDLTRVRASVFVVVAVVALPLLAAVALTLVETL